MYFHTIDEVLMDKADVFIDQWSKEYTDEPETSWDDIFGRVLDEFMRYADDEASANEEGYTIQERRDLNMLDDYDIRNEFNEFVSWLDLSDFDTEENINATRGGKNMKKFIRANKEMPFDEKAAPKKAVKADELYPENYNDLGYEGLDDAVDALKRAIENAKVMLSTLEGIADEYDEWGGSTPTIEMFAGPDDAIDFAEEMNKIADKLYDLDLYCPLP